MNKKTTMEKKASLLFFFFFEPPSIKTTSCASHFFPLLMRVSSAHVSDDSHYLPSTLKSKLNTSRQSASARRSTSVAIEMFEAEKNLASEWTFSRSEFS